MRSAVIAVVGIATAAGAYRIVTGSGRATTYAGASRVGEVATFAAGLALVVGAGVLSTAASQRRSPWLVLLGALAWFAPVYVAWQEGPAVVRSGALFASFFVFAFLAQILLGRQLRRAERLLLLAAYVEAVGAALLLALFRDPFLDPKCWANCSSNSFLVESLPRFSSDVESVDRYAVAVLGIALVAVVVARARGASPAGRRLHGLTGAVASVVGTGVAAHELAVQAVGVEDPFRESLRLTFALAAIAVVAVAAVAIAEEERGRRTRAAVARTAAQLSDAPRPGGIAAALAQALGDPDLRIAYPAVSRERYVGADGCEVELHEPANGRRTVLLKHRGRTLAVVEHRKSIDDLEQAVGPSLLIGLENERLRAVTLSQLEELRSARGRIVSATDAERRRLERDLHDGVQQRLLALVYTLRLARSRASADGEEDAVAALDAALERTETALDELRAVAHGIYPAVLSEVGLAAALRSLQDSAPLIVALTDVPSGRFEPSLEATVYFSILTAINDAAQRDASTVTVAVQVSDHETLTVSVTDDAEQPTELSAEVADRIGALDGVVEATGNRIWAEMSCV